MSPSLLEHDVGKHMKNYNGNTFRGVIKASPVFVVGMIALISLFVASISCVSCWCYRKRRRRLSLADVERYVPFRVPENIADNDDSILGATARDSMKVLPGGGSIKSADSIDMYLNGNNNGTSRRSRMSIESAIAAPEIPANEIVGGSGVGFLDARGNPIVMGGGSSFSDTSGISADDVGSLTEFGAELDYR